MAYALRAQGGGSELDGAAWGHVLSGPCVGGDYTHPDPYVGGGTYGDVVPHPHPCDEAPFVSEV